MKFPPFLAIALALISCPALAQSVPRSAAADVAEMTTNVCYLLASGGLVWAPRDVGEERRQVEAANLTYGIPAGVIDTLGPFGQTLVNRSTIASRTNDGSHILLARGGSLPGCRVMLAADEAQGAADAVSTALIENGWLRVEAFDTRLGAAERRFFTRFDENRRPFGLYLFISGDPSSRLVLFTTVLMM